MSLPPNTISMEAVVADSTVETLAMIQLSYGITSLGSTSYEMVAKKLTKIALTYCFVYTGILMWTVITALNSSLDFLPGFIMNINQNLLVFSSDLMTLSLPYILMIYDTNVRKHVLRQSAPQTLTNNFGFTSFQVSN
ncbi:unnamed protein product [Caenorhabditis brenneri]